MGINALIVDDSATMRSVIRKILKVAGVDLSKCLEASNGGEALDVLSREWVDVILTDIHMPQMDGIEFLKHLREDELLSRIPVIVVTTEGRDEIVNKAISLGARAHVKKPFRPETMRDILETTWGVEYARESAPELEGCDF